MTRGLLATLLTIPALYGLSVLIEYAITGLSRDFGHGFTAGVGLMIVR